MINKLREDLLAIIDYEPYRKAVDNFEQANDDVLIAGESLLLAQHKILIADPANNDRHLDKSQEKTPINDKIKSYFEILVNQENYSVGTVFGKQRNREALVLTAMTSQWFNFQGLFTMVEHFKDDLKILIKHK